VSRLNEKAALARVKIDFENAKYLNKKDKVEFWSDTQPEKRCSSYIEGRSNEYILIKIPQYAECVGGVHITTGAYLHFYSPDMERNMKVGRELLDILLKKKMALDARKHRYQKKLDNYPERVDAVNKRYAVLRKKLELEWEKELSNLEEDKAFDYKNYQSTELRLSEIEHKLEKYKIGDHNMKEDRWSLDPKLYIKK
jgi:hypothetical protein